MKGYYYTFGSTKIWVRGNLNKTEIKNYENQYGKMVSKQKA